MATSDTTSNWSYKNKDRSNNNNNASKQKPKLPFYPAFCFRASPTHFAWIKMGAADVHRLTRRLEYGERGLFFYQNHPIRFVNLVGIIVARADVPRRTILTLDDSTGATVDIVVLKRDPCPIPVAATVESKPKNNTDVHGEDGAQKEMHLTSTTQTPIDITPLQPGKLFQIKGTLSTFRSTNQVQLERFFPVPDTKTEMRFVEARMRFLAEVLTVPWALDEGDIENLRMQADEEGSRIDDEQARHRRRARKRAEREERERRRILKLWEQEEVVREREGKIAREAGRDYMLELERRNRLLSS
ncbi:hypothetical protein AN6240.2 [Aspergillus nidulans FGSC A4]|uniref:OB-fold nucleic acid binding domain (AFU_orthologue AFUA_2G13170) n=1 Tax=Emericella nidulans (strain FGSC A4 / ATCC 38163 / CBS 112.46 / NRRL 194 / M139) TaxID=227321 RepID=Q5AZP0_EMENI|nr:hypothetical protein [Aspergillus nidulans FGSC A4]EAA58624.1 hypothetical protein AN6240.2 [Aspergillus nidulans FGSC A4]CBF69879.1 TPA: OB-fold nucleic acid binding domain (AFU_orthologue; AFUA_2G13170) [Aspergillus nidulans FGSC A4]|eukprot:XP_663844.1 hypothetical protein AN6240.2 [Aspergillus nidulans FGSC A4]